MNSITLSSINNANTNNNIFHMAKNIYIEYDIYLLN